jgi:hypothetical protein
MEAKRVPKATIGYSIDSTRDKGIAWASGGVANDSYRSLAIPLPDHSKVMKLSRALPVYSCGKLDRTLKPDSVVGRECND